VVDIEIAVKGMEGVEVGDEIATDILAEEGSQARIDQEVARGIA